MPAPYHPLAVANLFIQKGVAAGAPLDPMKLQKLVYYGHGWNLGLFGEPLIDEPVEAWPYGPVIPSIYHEFKVYGSSTIDEPALEVGRWGGRPRPIRLDSGDRRTDALLGRVWESYSRFSGIQLSRMTHAPGTPWEITHRNRPPGISRGLDISNDLIRQHFEAEAAANRAIAT